VSFCFLAEFTEKRGFCEESAKMGQKIIRICQKAWNNVKFYKRLGKIYKNTFTIHTIYVKITLTAELERKCHRCVLFDSFYSL